MSNTSNSKKGIFDFAGSPARDMSFNHTSMTNYSGNPVNNANYIKYLMSRDAKLLEQQKLASIANLPTESVMNFPIDNNNNNITTRYGQELGIHYTFTGIGNNPHVSSRGSSGSSFMEIIPNTKLSDLELSDNLTDTNTSTSIRPRLISNKICKIDTPTDTALLSDQNLSDMVWLFGQFVDHDITLTRKSTDPSSTILSPTGSVSDLDEEYPDRVIPFTRSARDPVTNKIPNGLSSVLDMSNVYGFENNRSIYLRRLDGTGKLKTSLSQNGEQILPLNEKLLENDLPSGLPHSPDTFFIAGDVRSNEHAFLTALHSLFVNEHNRICDDVATRRPDLINQGNDEAIFNIARRFNIAQYQNVVYSEFLPALLGTSLGTNLSSPYTGYNSQKDATISLEFNTVGYRMGHTMISSELMVNAPTVSNGVSFEPVALRDVFFNSTRVKTGGFYNLIEGVVSKKCQNIDSFIVDDLRNFLFGPPSQQMILDLASLNIARGRDHGVSNYLQMRESFNLKSDYTTFDNLPMPQDTRDNVKDVYHDTLSSIDAWIGGICETHKEGSPMGELMSTIIRDQFERLRSGDRLFFENTSVPFFSQSDITQIKQTTLASIIRKNKPFNNLSTYQIPDDVFHV